MTHMRKGHTLPVQKPGDIFISDDERSVYVVDQHGSNRRLKNKDLVASVLHRFHEMKQEEVNRQAAKAAGLELPGENLTVDPKTILTAAAAMSTGQPVEVTGR